MRRPTAHRGLLAALGLLFALGVAGAAQAHIYSEWQPRLTLGAGYDDNILLNAQGGDSFGQVLPGLKLYLYGDHGMQTTLDCQVGLSRLMHPEQYQAAGGDLVVNQLCGGNFRQRLGTRTALKLSLRTQYAQDPFSVANLGLLLRPGQHSIFNTLVTSELSYRTSVEGTVLFGVDEYSLFFTKGDPGNGMVVTPHFSYEQRFTPYDTWTAGLRQQTFFSLSGGADTWAGNTTGVASAALAGYKHRFSMVTELTATAGPALLNRPGGTDVLPVGRIDLEMATPSSGLHFTALHDLVLGPLHGGPLLGDIAEGSGLMNLTDALIGRLHLGLYRNGFVGNANGGVIGYSAGAGLDVRLGRAWLVGASVGREARLQGDAIDHQVDRNVVQLRLTWEAPRNW